MLRLSSHHRSSLFAIVASIGLLAGGCAVGSDTPSPEDPAPDAEPADDAGTPAPDAPAPDAPAPDAPAPDAPAPDAPAPDAPAPDAPAPDAPAPDAPAPEPDVPAVCDYPGGTQGFNPGETLPPYAWSNAFGADGTNAPLRLDEAPCDLVEWSPFDTLVFIAIPAW